MKYSLYALLFCMLLTWCTVVKAPENPAEVIWSWDQNTNIEATLPNTVWLPYISLGDDGASWDPVWCGDSLVYQDVPVPSTIQDWNSLISRTYGQTIAGVSVWNQLQSFLPNTLSVNSVTFSWSSVEVMAYGTLSLGGVCDNPRVQAQLEWVVSQFTQYDEVGVYINWESLEDYLSLQ